LVWKLSNGVTSQSSGIHSLASGVKCSTAAAQKLDGHLLHRYLVTGGLDIQTLAPGILGGHLVKV